MTDKTRLLFLGPAFFILALMLWKYNGGSGGMETYLLYMVLLSFPCGLLIPLMHVALFRLFGITLPATWMTLVLTWAALAMLGYLQWFVLLPRLGARWRGGRRR